MINSLLAADASQILTYVFLGILVVAIIAMFVFSSNRRKKQEQEAQDLINAVKPGNKVKTIGGICGIVVEVDNEENTFVLETGTEKSGKCYIKFDRQAIYQTDAVVEKKEENVAQLPAAVEAIPTEEPALIEEHSSIEENAPVEIKEEQPEITEEPKVEETKTEEAVAADEPAKAPAKKTTKKKS